METLQLPLDVGLGRRFRHWSIQTSIAQLDRSEEEVSELARWMITPHDAPNDFAAAVAALNLMELDGIS